jgi:phosphatidylglycerol:prolipoprotein diacylglycerol transferase
MFPVLFKIGKWPIYTYGLFIAIGTIVAILFVGREAKKLGQDHEQIMDLCIYLLIAAIVGSRLFYIFSNPKLFLSDPLEIFRIWNGGLVFYGGFVIALVTAILYLKRKKLSLFLTADIMAPPLALGHFFGRLGCLFAGCCYGKATDLPWAITFTNTESLAPLGVPLHPTQLYAAINNLLIFVFL